MQRRLETYSVGTTDFDLAVIGAEGEWVLAAELSNALAQLGLGETRQKRIYSQYKEARTIITKQRHRALVHALGLTLVHGY